MISGLAGRPCTNRDHAFDGSVRDALGRCPKCIALLNKVCYNVEKGDFNERRRS
jgi:hypothetical protein